jgi:hypothetical protein
LYPDGDYSYEYDYEYRQNLRGWFDVNFA